MKRDITKKTFLISSLMLGCISAPVLAQTLTRQGPSPFVSAGSEALLDTQVGAVNAIATHPTDADIIYLGTVNGGVWKTENGTDANPNWTALTDDQASLSITDVAFDPTDTNNQTLVAGVGRVSSLGRLGGLRTGLLMTTDGGDNWTAIDGGLEGANVTGVAARGNVIVATADASDSNTCDDIGIFRSTDSGTTFTQVTNGISGGSVDGITGDPSNNSVLYAGIVLATSTCGGTTGIYKSTNTGESWTKISDATMDAMLLDEAGTHVEIAVGNNDNVYVSINNSDNTRGGIRLAGVFRSGDGGTTFTQMDLPGTMETVDPNDLMLMEFWGIHAGGQGSIHSSLIADPNNDNIVYIGGDRQPANFNDGNNANGQPFFPNSINANGFNGRMFRGDASQTAGSQWAPLTHNATAGNTSAHADSRDMVFTADGNLLQSDDGGIYRRTSPQDNTGDWTSISGDLQNTEVHSADYDSNSDILGGGTQDNSQGNQVGVANNTWQVLIGGDGGDYDVDNLTLAGVNQSLRYTSVQNLGVFVRVTRGADGSFVSFERPALSVVSGDVGPIPQFVTPVDINTENGNRLIIGFSNREIDDDDDGNDGGIYESLDQGDTLTQLNPPGIVAEQITGRSIAYGAPGNEDQLYVVNRASLFRRINAGDDLVPVFNSTNFLVSVSQDQGDATQAFIVERDGSVFWTQDTGDNWADVGGNLASLDPGQFRTVLHASNPFATGKDILFAGSRRGVFMAREETGYTTWEKLPDFPNATVLGLVFDATINELFINTLGRGTFTYGPLFDVSDDIIFANGFEMQP